LAKSHGLHDYYLQIQLEVTKNYKDSLDYIGQLDFYGAEISMKKYGSILMKHLPKDTTELLKLLCTDFKGKNEPLVTQEMLEGRVKPTTLKVISNFSNVCGGGHCEAISDRTA
jgi:hypothetical protein